MPYDLVYGQFEHKKKTFWRDIFLLLLGVGVVHATRPGREDQ
jgi:hypothetical protein